MAIIAKTQEDFINSMIAFVEAYNTENGTNYDIRQGTTLKDIMIDSPSKEFASLSTDLVYTSKVPSLVYAEELEASDLNNLGANYGKSRNLAAFATGAIDFIADETPSASVVINAGVAISTESSQNENPVEFLTTETVVMDVTNLPTYAFIEDSITKYKISVSIRAVAPGSAGNVGSGTITVLNQSVQGITRVNNQLATLNGTDEESNVDFAARIQLALTGNNIGTEDGMKSIVLKDSRSLDVAVVGPLEPEMLRNQFGGAVDIYALGSDPTTITEAPVFFLSEGSVTLTNSPVISVATVTGLVLGVPTNFPIGTLAVFVKDTGLLADSSKETSIVTFPTAIKPDNGTAVEVTMNYDRLTQDLQVEFDKTQNHIVGADILVRKPIEVLVNAFMKIGIFSGFTPIDVANAVKTTVSTFINSRNLGGSINASDLIAIAEGVAGVDSIDIPSFIPTSNIIILKNQVAVAGTISVQIGLITY